MKFKKFTKMIFALAIVVLAFSALAFAGEKNAPATTTATETNSHNGAAAFYFGMTVLAAGLSIAIGTIATGLGQGNAVAKAVEGIARQPEAAGTIQTVMIIGLAFIESLTIYVLLIALILLFVNPFEKYFH